MFNLLDTRVAKGLATAFGILTGVGAVLSWLTPEWFGQLTFSQAMLVGIGMALGASFLIAASLALGGWGFRLIRPLPVEAPLKDSKTGTTVGDLPDVRLGKELHAVAARTAALEEKSETIIYDYQTVLAKHTQSEEKSKALEIELGDVRRGCAALEEKISENEKGFRESMHALMARDDLAALSSEIQSDADSLYLPLKAGEKYDKARWQSWESIHAHWEKTVKRWADVARWYGKNVRANILTVDDTEYENEWSVEDHQFPNADAVRRFKRFRIIQVHWMTVSDEVAGNVLMVARGAISEREAHGGKCHQ